MNVFLEFLKFSLNNTQWWFGFFIGALIFLVIGVNWHLMSRPQEWYAVGAIAAFCGTVIWFLKH